MDIKGLILNIVSSLFVVILFFFLWRTGRRHNLHRREGWGYVLAGFGLILLGMLMGIASQLPFLGRYVSFGETSSGFFLKNFLGYVLGYFFLTVGLLKWIPAIVSLRETKRALHESEQRFDSIAGQAPDAIILTDEQGKISFWNPAAENIFWYSPDEALGMNITDIFPSLPADHPMRNGPRAEYLKNTDDAVILEELTARRKNGVKFPVELSVSSLTVNGLRHSAGIARDMGEREHLRNQLLHAQKMELVGRLAAGVAHDFNNILTSIMGYCELLRMKMDNADPRCKYVDNILGASRRGSNLSQRLLAFSRQQLLEKRIIDLSRTLLKLESLLSRLLGEDLECKVKVPRGSLPVLADEAQIEQVLINLATNARDAMPKGGRLAIEAEKVGAGAWKAGMAWPESVGECILVTVNDTGTGMDESTIAHIYDPFFTTKEVGKGTGLGLSIVYSVLQQHDGGIQVESRPGKGTTFRLYLPLSTEKEEPFESQIWEQPPGGTETILVAEDDQTVRALMVMVLQEAGYQVLEALNGLEALKHYHKHGDQIDLLFLDVVMPKKDGRMVYDEISAGKPLVKVIFVSGYSGEILQRRGIPDGGFHFIPKPLSPTAILQSVREVLDE